MKLLYFGAEGGAYCRLLLSASSESISIYRESFNLPFGSADGFTGLGDGLAVLIIRDEEDWLGSFSSPPSSLSESSTSSSFG